MTSMIRVRREKSARANRFRAFKIVVNGVERATVKNASTVDIPIEPGQFSIQARIAWCNSRAMTSTVEDEHTVTFVVRNGDSTALVGGTTEYLDIREERFPRDRGGNCARIWG